VRWARGYTGLAKIRVVLKQAEIEPVITAALLD